MDETRWLDREEQIAWRTFMVAANLLFEQLDRELRVETSIPMNHYEILVRLSEAPGRSLRMSELAERCLSSRSHLSHTVDKLQTAGWVRRDSCPSDRRGAVAVLTDAGFAALAEAAPAHVESVRRNLFDRLEPSQVAQLRLISEKLLPNLVAAQERPACEQALLGLPGDA